jgi:hypothetical protein
LATSKPATSKLVTVVCKERRCSKSFTVELAKLLVNKGSATCPYCRGVSRFKAAEYTFVNEASDAQA